MSRSRPAPRPPAATPAALGFRMPAEWAPHRATWIAWPHRRSDWPGKFAAIPWVYVEIVRSLSRGERVAILVRDRGEEERAARMLEKAGVDLDRVEFHRFPTDRSWTRDSGPIFVVRPGDEARGRRERVAITDWRFNAWAKYSDWRRDDRIPARAAAALGLDRFEPAVVEDGARRRVVLEGGSIDADGDGLLLTTEECLLSPVQARNPGLEREQLERALAEYLGIEKVLWLGRGIAGDDTHGHVDDIARFVAPGKVAAAREDDPADDNHEPLRENLERLRRMTDRRGRPLEVVEIPMPRPLYFEGRRLPASYLNFYISNRAVLVPTFNDPADREALGILAELFPGREVAGMHAVDLVWGLGTLHCMTQQEPE